MKTDFNSMSEAIDSLHSQIKELKELVKSLAPPRNSEETESFNWEILTKEPYMH